MSQDRLPATRLCDSASIVPHEKKYSSYIMAHNIYDSGAKVNLNGSSSFRHSYGRDSSRPALPCRAAHGGVMNHARTNDVIPFLSRFTLKDGDPAPSCHWISGARCGLIKEVPTINRGTTGDYFSFSNEPIIITINKYPGRNFHGTDEGSSNR